MTSTVQPHFSDDALHEAITRASATYGSLNIHTEPGQQGASSLEELEAIRALIEAAIEEVSPANPWSDTWVQCDAEQLRLHDEVKIVTQIWTLRGLVDQGNTLRPIGIDSSRYADRLSNPESRRVLRLNELDEGATIFRKAGMPPAPDAQLESAILVRSYVNDRGDIITLDEPRLVLWHTGMGEYCAYGLSVPPHDVIDWSPIMVTAQAIDPKHYGQRQ